MVLEHLPKKQKSGGGFCPHPLFTFQLFIYKSLSTWYNYPIKRTRDVWNLYFIAFYLYNKEKRNKGWPQEAKSP